MASGILGVRGAAALSPAMADGRGEPGCVRGQRWLGSSVMAPERKSESAVTNAVQVSQRIIRLKSEWKWGDDYLCGGDDTLHKNNRSWRGNADKRMQRRDERVWIYSNKWSHWNTGEILSNASIIKAYCMTFKIISFLKRTLKHKVS